MKDPETNRQLYKSVGLDPKENFDHIKKALGPDTHGMLFAGGMANIAKKIAPNAAVIHDGASTVSDPAVGLPDIHTGSQDLWPEFIKGLKTFAEAQEKPN